MTIAMTNLEIIDKLRELFHINDCLKMLISGMLQGQQGNVGMLKNSTLGPR